MTTITINGQPVDATRIDELLSTVLHSRDHVVPAMRDGLTVKLTVAQVLSLINKDDMLGKLVAGDVPYDPSTAGPLTALDVQAALDEIAARAALDPTGTGMALLTAASPAAARQVLEVPGALVKVSSATLSSQATTTSTTMSNVGLNLAFAPTYADSLLEVEVSIPRCDIYRVAGTIVDRYGTFRIMNATDTVVLGGNSIFGYVLTAASAVAGTYSAEVIMKRVYAPGAATSKTYSLQFASSVTTNVLVDVRGDTVPARMTIREVRPYA